MICCSCGKEVDINYGREYWNGIYCKKCADEMLSTPEYIKNYKRIIADLQAENAALRSRLEEAVVVKAKVDDTIYLPWIYDGVSGVGKLQVCAVHFLMDGSVIYATDLDDGLGEQEIDFLSKYHYGNFSDDDFGIMVFTDEQAAEARLAELKGEEK